MASHPLDTEALPDRRTSRRRRLRLGALLAPVVVTSVASLTGTALAPTLLVTAPLLLIALNPVFRHLVMVSGVVDPKAFFAVALLRLFAPDPFYYWIGRLYGRDAVTWVERRSGGAGSLIRWLERAFDRLGLVLLFVAPVGLVCVLAGASRVKPWVFVVVDLLGTLAAVTLVHLFGKVMAEPIEVVRVFVEANLWLLTAISVCLVVISTLLRRRRGTKPRDPG